MTLMAEDGAKEPGCCAAKSQQAGWRAGLISAAACSCRRRSWTKSLASGPGLRATLPPTCPSAASAQDTHASQQRQARKAVPAAYGRSGAVFTRAWGTNRRRTIAKHRPAGNARTRAALHRESLEQRKAFDETHRRGTEHVVSSSESQRCISAALTAPTRPPPNMVAYLAALPTYLAATWRLRTGWEEAACIAYRNGIQGTMRAADALSRASGAVLTAFFSVYLQGWQMAML